MEKITYQLAELADLAAIVTIYNEAIPSRVITADLQEVTVAERTPWFLAHHDRRPLYVVLQAGKIVGWISLSDFYGRIAYQGTVEVSIYLTQAVAGCGIGSQALAFAEEEAKKLGITTLLGFVFSGNVPSCHLFKKFGYETYGFLPTVADMETSVQDLIIFGKKI
ncbi:GNAT family N-acetyltransferase [Enterococcus nangangensis]|uniref:GNAT family N-acetyltransferase n=1 Tax=Enterococcus nangangensis TaxID=2559926 RepID=UPI001BB2890C|nr:GNAT family N-acetyltransferase [Enterococcus nangangensis]